MLMIDKTSHKPIYEQIIDGVEKNILLGLYPPGSVLPSQRELSVTLGINPNTIQKSYAELIRRGVIVPAQGSGSYVASDAVARIRAAATERLDHLRETVAELALARVPCEDVLAVVREVYETHPSVSAGADPVPTTIITKGGKPL